MSRSVSRQPLTMPHTLFKVLLLVASAALCVTQDTKDAKESRIVQTSQGPVKGYKTDDIFYFYGIPYATAPTGTRRFTAPLPGPIWISPLEAVNDKITCPQGRVQLIDTSGLEHEHMREDCLVANIYVPDTEETNLPVVVYVHGGAYHIGSGVSSSPKPLVASKKVIAVTFNYRLGAHGFLCLGTENAPGNAGMKDQVALLRWVQKNIANFGGNPNEVTIAGYSAGSSAVELLMLSDMTKGLYNKVIPESGASVASWSVQLDPVLSAKDYAKQLNFTKNVDDIKSLEEFYVTLPFETLMSDTFLDKKNSSFVFSPCVESDTGAEQFLTDTPLNILTQGKYRKVPVLYGFANMEGLFRAMWFEQWQEVMNEKFSDFLPADLQFKDDEEKERVAQEIKKFYFGNERISVKTLQGFIDYFSDVIFAYPHLRSVKLQVDAGSDAIYLYEYSFFRPYAENAPIPEHFRKIKGAGHCAQTFTVLDSVLSGFDDPDPEEYTKMKKTMVELWVNFITTGKPVPAGSNLPSWPPVGADRSPYMDLGEEIKLKGTLLEKRTLFWDAIYERFYRSPVAPSTRKVRSEL